MTRSVIHPDHRAPTSGVGERERMVGSRERSWLWGLSAAIAAAPALVLAVMGMQRRWVSEDAFISLRVVDHILAGHGPVFNTGERVEAYTHPLWIAILALWGLADLPATEGSVILGLLFALAGLIAAQAGALQLQRALYLEATRGRIVELPLGALVFVAVPVVWDFVTSGLETGLSFGWLGLSFWLLARGAVGNAACAPFGAALVIGLGPLVRPDLALFSLAFFAALVTPVVLGDARLAAIRRVCALASVALALPLAYQIFRMGYFVALVPNTALAKEAGEPRWSQGWVYLRDFVDPYALWLPLLVLLAFVIRDARRAAALRRPAIFVALVAPVGAAALHALYVARVGGDFMHGRFLLPTLFGLILPAATVCVRLPEASARRAVATGVAAAGIAAWALVAAVWLRVPYQQTNGPDGIADERGVYVENSGHPHPVTLADYMGMRQTWPRDGATWRARATHAPRVLVVDGQELPLAGWVDPSAGIAAMAHNVGLAGVAAGRRVHVVDTYGLADPLAGRLLLSERGRPGHEKRLPVAWVIARFSEPAAGEPADVASARRALACGEPARLHDAVTGPLTFGRFLRNLRDAWSFHDLRIPDDPATAERQLCEPA